MSLLENYFQCVNCGKLNIASEARIAEEEKERWTMWAYPSIRRMFNQICARKHLDMNQCLEYLIALDVKENAVKHDDRFGVPGTGTGSTIK